MKNVLIVEDDRLLALMLEDVLLQSGYRVEHAFDLEEGDAVVDAKPIDAAILDIRVEGGLSFELARKLDRLHIPYLFASSARRLDMPPDLRWRPLIGKPYTASQVVTIATRGIKAENEVSLIGSVLLGVLLVWFFSVGVIRARIVRVVIVWIVLVLSGIAELVAVFNQDDATDALPAIVGLVTTVVSLLALNQFRQSAWYAWQRTKPPTDQGESIGGLVAIAVAVGALGGLVGPAEDGFRVEFNASGQDSSLQAS